MKKNSPIILFVYNRLWHTQQTVEALQKNDLASESELFIYADGAKQENDIKVIEVRNYIKTITDFKKVTIIERDKNWGLADNIIDGVSTIVNKYGKIIVLEDDIVTSVGFLKYMNDALAMYQDEDKVMHISGYMSKVKKKLPTTFFYNQTSCGGWATWKKSWELFNSNTLGLYKKVVESRRIKEFNIENSYPFLSHLEANVNGTMKTWAIKWHTSVFLSYGLCLHPAKSFVQNIGFDNSGVHCEVTSKFNINELNKGITLSKLKLKENKKARKAVSDFNNNFNNENLAVKMKNRIKAKIKKLWY